MLLTFFQTGIPPMGELVPFIIMGVLAVVDILLLKLALVLTKAEKRNKIKWVAGSFAIQFGIIFIISSPLFFLGFMGKFQGQLNVIIPIIILSSFIDLNMINVLHQVGLKRSLGILLLTFVPLMMIMISLGETLSQMP